MLVQASIEGGALEAWNARVPLPIRCAGATCALPACSAHVAPLLHGLATEQRSNPRLHSPARWARNAAVAARLAAACSAQHAWPTLCCWVVFS